MFSSSELAKAVRFRGNAQVSEPFLGANTISTGIPLMSNLGETCWKKLIEPYSVADPFEGKILTSECTKTVSNRRRRKICLANMASRRSGLRYFSHPFQDFYSAHISKIT